MNENTPQYAPRKSNAGAVVFWVIVTLLVLGFIGAHAAQSMTVTSCNTLTQTCNQQTYPVTNTGS